MSPAALSGAICVSSCVSGAAGHARLLGSKVPGKLPEVPALEKMYRKWFAGKSDVWRLCSDIVDIMDGRSWPIAQKKKVHHSADPLETVCTADFCTVQLALSCVLDGLLADVNPLRGMPGVCAGASHLRLVA